MSPHLRTIKARRQHREAWLAVPEGATREVRGRRDRAAADWQYAASRYGEAFADYAFALCYPSGGSAGWLADRLAEAARGELPAITGGAA